MAKDCGCSGSTCGCLIVAGDGIEVSGIGTAANPFVVSRDTVTDSIGSQLEVDNSTSVVMTKLGSGTAADPIILKAAVQLSSPNGALWGLAVANDGTLTAVAL